MATQGTKTLAAGMKILAGGNMSTYTLEFLTPSGQHSRGSYVTIAVPYACLGRSSKCAVQLEDKTVSREHAAIEKKGNDVYILNLSKTNPTLVNGRPVNNKYYLNNGDEIQLSLEGPRLRFNQTSSGTSRMGLTNRWNMVMQQSIKPYKNIALGFIAVFLIALSAAGYATYDFKQKLSSQEKFTKEQIEFARKEGDSLKIALEKQVAMTDDVSLIEPLKNKVVGIFLNKRIIRVGGKEYVKDLGGNLMCTGFILENGLFVTARHCIDQSNTDVYGNYHETNGSTVTYHFTARSYDNSINFDFTNREMTANYSTDRFITTLLRFQNGSSREKIRVPNFFNGSDWAYKRTSFKTGVKFDKTLSTKIKAGTKLIILGYSYGSRHRGSNLEPNYTTAKVTRSGIQEDGTIHVTEAGFDQGNSGGPVFVRNENGEAMVIGIVTAIFQNFHITQRGDQVNTASNEKMITPLPDF